MSIAARLAALALIAASFLVLPPAAAADEPEASAARSCRIPNGGRGLGPTYVRTLDVTRTSCGRGVDVVKAFYRCRVANGGRDGRCRSRVLGYRCTERRSNVIRTQYDAHVTCAREDARVFHRYTQFT